MGVNLVREISVIRAFWDSRLGMNRNIAPERGGHVEKLDPGFLLFELIDCCWRRGWGKGVGCGGSLLIRGLLLCAKKFGFGRPFLYLKACGGDCGCLGQEWYKHRYDVPAQIHSKSVTVRRM
eukprot:3282821-Rhodomonas_salina.1